MQAHLVPSLRGWRWLADGWKIFRSAPLMWLVIVLGYFMLMTAVSLVPFVGVFAAFILVPGFSVAFMAASRVAEHGQPIQVSLLFAGFRENVRAQLGLGAIYLISIALILYASTFADDGALVRWLTTGAKPDVEAIQSEAIRNSMMLVMALYTPVMMLFWFAPTLVAWHSMPVAKALFYSLFACLMNWRPFVVYGVAAALLLFAVLFCALFVLVLLSGGAVMANRDALFPFVLSVLPTLFASFYASYRDIFAREDPAQSS